MNFLPHQYNVGRRNEIDVCRRNCSCQINGTARQYQANEIRENAGEGLQLCKVHKSVLGTVQQCMQDLVNPEKG